MKLSKLFHIVSVVSGCAGVVALLGAWSAGTTGTAFGFTQPHLFIDAIVLVLIAIWLQLATMHHIMLEKKGEIV